MSGEDPSRGRNLVLVGYRGCGKSAVGRLVAERLGWAYVDTDEQIAAEAGKSISEIFAEDGEPAFRALESAAVARVVRGAEQVISVGGGAVLRDANRRALKAAGVCVWLTASAEELDRRVAGDPQSAALRPALTAHGGLDEVRALLASRAPLYASMADHVVATDGRTIAQVAEAVLALVRPDAAERGECSMS